MRAVVKPGGPRVGRSPNGSALLSGWQPVRVAVTTSRGAPATRMGVGMRKKGREACGREGVELGPALPGAEFYPSLP